MGTIAPLLLLKKFTNNLNYLYFIVNTLDISHCCFPPTLLQTCERMSCQEKNDDQLPEENYPKVKLKDCDEGDVFTVEEDPQCPDALKSLNENKNLPR